MIQTLQDLWNSPVTWWGGIFVLAAVILVGMMGVGLVIATAELSKTITAKTQAWWAIHQVSLHVANPVTITLIVSAALVLCVRLVMYLSPYQTCVRLTILDGYDLDEA